MLFAKRSCILSQPLIFHSNYSYTQLSILFLLFLLFLWFLSKIITVYGKTSMASKEFNPLIFPFCQEMLMFKGILFLILFSFMKTTVAEGLQRHRFLKLWRSLKSFPHNILKIYGSSIVTLQQGSDKVEKMIRECSQKSRATEKQQPMHLSSTRWKLPFPFCSLKNISV